MKHVLFALSLPLLSLSAKDEVSFNKDVRPILADRCYHCHGPDAQEIKGKLQLHTFEHATGERVYKTKSGKERRRDAAIIPGRPDESIVWERISTDDEDEIMPPLDSVAKQLTDDEKAILKKWIEQGAKYEKHWAFVAPKKKSVAVKSSDWCKNDIDRYIMNQLETLGLEPNQEASKETLIRRLSLDLRGIPPSLEEIDIFLNDKSEKAYENLLDRMLADKAFGEKMAVEWLDVASYGDSNGLFEDGARSVWPWRDWVIKAFNDNKAFDEFITEQVAGDLLPNPSQEQIIATGFYRNNPVSREGGIIDEEYLIQYAGDRVKTTGIAFLGMSLDCASCHDHKYDPLSQKNFYEMSAFFRSIDEKGKVDKTVAKPFIKLPSKEQKIKIKAYNADIATYKKDLKKLDTIFLASPIKVKKVRLHRVDAIQLILNTIKFIGQADTKVTMKSANKSQKFDNLLKAGNEKEIRVRGNHPFIEFEFENAFELEAVEISTVKKHFRYLNGSQLEYFDENGELIAANKIEKSTESLLLEPLSKEFASLLRKQNEAVKALQVIDKKVPTTLVMKELATPRKTHILERGSYEHKKEEVFPGVPESILEFDPTYPRNRLGLAKWLVDKRNPLTARVTMNRYWQLLFGRGLVRTAEDFGLQGDLPSNQELLDFLASDFQENGWNLKVALKQILMSATYRQSSTQVETKVQKDAENKYLSYGSRRRLEAEFIRDNALAMSGLLVNKQGGAPVYPYQPAGLWKEKSTAMTFKASVGDDLYRKTLYTFWRRTSPHPSSIIFDATDRTTCVARRRPTNTPLQALVTLNDEQYVEAARVLAQRMMTEGGKSLDQRLQFAWRLATARRASKAELDLLKKEYTYRSKLYKEKPDQAKLYLDVGESKQINKLDQVELASYMSVAQIILNLDETITRN
jgi:hypothetical protein